MPLMMLRGGNKDTHYQTISVSSPFALFEIEPLNRHVFQLKYTLDKPAYAKEHY